MINFLVLIENDRLYRRACRYSEEEIEVGVSAQSFREACKLARVDRGVEVVCSIGKCIRHEQMLQCLTTVEISPIRCAFFANIIRILEEGGWCTVLEYRLQERHFRSARCEHTVRHYDQIFQSNRIRLEERLNSGY